MSLASSSEVLERKYSAPQVAKILNVDKMTVYRLVDRGELVAYRVGRTYQIPMRSLREYLGRNLIQPEENDA